MKIEDFIDSWMKENKIAWGAASERDVIRMVKDVLALPRYTEDIEEAWGMIEALKDLDPDIRTVVSWDGITWNCTIRRGDDFVTSSYSTAPTAISRALDHWKGKGV